MEKIVKVTLYTVPQAACGEQKMSWQDVAAMVKNHLERSFSGMYSFRHTEFMNDQWFEDIRAQELLEKGDVNLPFVLVDDEIASNNKKVNISSVIKIIQKQILS